jgi:PPK2 family polyphosphate:nucleotide phosphotransferase
VPRKKPAREAGHKLASWRFDVPGAAVDLQTLDPAAKPCTLGSKAKDQERVEQLAVELDTLQNVLFAARQRKLLVVLQGTDGSGKDGTIRHVFGQMSALGVRTVGFRAPSEEERSHDYLWRIHRQLPALGEIVIFNRSHYEDVLVPVVNRSITPEQTAQRFAQINDFERMLSENATVVLKFLLHISKDEQRERLQARLDDPTKHWKFERGDLEVRKQWDDYRLAYSNAIAATGTEWAPWTIVPADSKTHRNLMIANAMKQAFERLKLRYPPGDPALVSIDVE